MPLGSVKKEAETRSGLGETRSLLTTVEQYLIIIKIICYMKMICGISKHCK